ncbi:MAG: hypothetical protein F6K50_15560 [Moorea sp. SIO3I7]|uniref:hypothetical protein n=1 Tax=unclassified Moorena TaxID=2683338 RepID=UPI0013C229BE|nr:MULTISPECIES: hypothetical protein [unclassified Moorena]NEN96897.1 hypothetical protein [Moorena sp. SIO3I7]NEO08858.1 hypothetical protein [Moorena sp. SIO3I8]NEO21858.1 hypothetical protein [Moorena sp. SIO4A5]NEP26374.1 hypothetical protein [Moorena sp. SIO3I6]NEQ59298.1 hypothetical protein [Moorena sp. SIO4A1]
MRYKYLGFREQGAGSREQGAGIRNPPLTPPRRVGLFHSGQKWGDGEMGRWGEFWTNSRDFGQIYLTILKSRITNC